MIDGWLGTRPEPHLIGRRCRACGTLHFPPTVPACRHPRCQSGDVEDVPLSRRGVIWSYTVNRYAPPPPYPAPDPFVPYAVAAVELDAERMIVLGQVARDTDLDRLAVGMAVELVAGAPGEGQPWMWRPVDGPAEEPPHA